MLVDWFGPSHHPPTWQGALAGAGVPLHLLLNQLEQVALRLEPLQAP
jgi:hypothetical protein